jgi:hypothetical protein
MACVILNKTEQDCLCPKFYITGNITPADSVSQKYMSALVISIHFALLKLQITIFLVYIQNDPQS